MNCNSGIRDDDSDVDIETVTDTAWSVEMPGDSIQNITSVSAPISIKPLLGFKNTNFQDDTPNPITRSYRIKKIPSKQFGKISVSQALSLKSQTENSAARCFVILGQEPKLPNEKKLTKVQTQPKYTQLHNRVGCRISAATSATTTVRQLARRTYIRNPAVLAIDKEGSYQHYLHRQIKQLKSKMFTYALNVDRQIRLYLFALDSYIPDFVHEFALMKSKVGSDDYESQFELLTSKAQSCASDLAGRSHLINSMLNSYANDLEMKIMSLNCEIASFTHDLGMQITLMNSTINSFDVNLTRKLAIMNSRSRPFSVFLNGEYALLMPERVLV